MIQGLFCWKREREEAAGSRAAGSHFVAMREEPEKRTNMAEVEQQDRERGRERDCILSVLRELLISPSPPDLPSIFQSHEAVLFS